MTVDQNGITTTNGVTFTWDELNNQFTSDQERAQVLAQAGLTQEQVQQFLPALRTYEQSKYKDYQQSKGTKRDVGGGLLKIGEGLAGIMTGPLGFGRQVQGYKDLIGSKGKTDYAKDYANSPLAGLVNQVGEQQKVQQATGQGAAGAGVGFGLPPISQEALDMYTKNYVLPAQSQLHNLIQGDMAQWQSALGAISNETGQKNSPVSNLIQAYAQAQSPLYQMLGDVTAQAQLTQPYTNLMNQAVGSSATEGAKLAALGTTGQNLALYGLLNPQVASLLQQSAGAFGGAQGAAGGGLGALTSILGQSGLTGNKPAGVP